MSARNDFREQVREDERRKRDEAKVQTLQAQIDEVRHLTRELLSRQGRIEEQLKASEAAWAQHRLTMEQHRHEVAQSAQARQLEEARVRQQIVDLSTRIDDSTRPIRSIQAHVSELIETVRRQRDDVGHDTKRFDELRALIDHLAAHGERQVVVAQSLRDSIDALRIDVERQQRDIMRTDDSVKIVEQEVRRRVAEVVQQIENVDARLNEEAEGVAALVVQIEDVRHATTLFDPQIDVLREALQRIDEEISRFQAQARERDDLAAERLEEVRQQLTTQVRDLEQITSQQIERVAARSEQLDEVDRELAYRINMAEVQFEELHQVDDRLRREVWYLHEQRSRMRFEQAQQELEMVMETRRDAEKRAGSDRPTE